MLYSYEFLKLGVLFLDTKMKKLNFKKNKAKFLIVIKKINLLIFRKIYQLQRSKEKNI